MAEIVAGSTATMAAARAWARARLYDDKLGEPDAPRLAAWAESIERWKLDAPDLIEGVIRHYEAQAAPTIQIGDLLHHTQHAGIAAGVGAHGADLVTREIEAAIAQARLGRRIDERLRQIPREGRVRAKHVEGQASGGLLADAGQAGEDLDEPRDRIHQRRLRTCPACPCRR